MKTYALLFILLIPSSLLAQKINDKLIDSRDGRVYKLVRIDSLIWFQDNLMFSTATSFYPNDTKKESKCPNGNFYTYRDLDSVCPDGWRIPNEKDWQKYFEYRILSQDGSMADVILDSITEEYLTINFRDTAQHVKLLEENNPLRITDVGWVQGGRRRSWGTTSF